MESGRICELEVGVVGWVEEGLEEAQVVAISILINLIALFAVHTNVRIGTTSLLEKGTVGLLRGRGTNVVEIGICVLVRKN